MIRTKAPLPSSAANPFASIVSYVVNEASLTGYLRDASNLCGRAERILMPSSEEEVAQILAEAGRTRTAVTVAGAGTGMAGARVPEGGLLLATDKMNKVRRIEWDEKHGEGYAVLAPGVILKDFEETVESRVLFYLSELPRSGMQYLIFRHLGDNHLHPNLLAKSADEFHRAKDIYETLVRKALALGGTVSAEHGIGKLKVRYLEWMAGREAVKAMGRVKRALDPDGILGSGNIISHEIWQEVVQEGHSRGPS